MTCLQCGIELSGKQSRYCSDSCRLQFWSKARKRGAEKVGTMHVGRLETCVTLQKILARLERGPATTLELHEVSGSMATSTDVSALNKNLLGTGRQVLCQYKGMFAGRKVFEYSLVGL